MAIGLDRTAIEAAGFDKMAIGGANLGIGKINQVFSRNLKFAHGPAVDEFFTREIVKVAIRAPNPEIWPCLNYLVFETSI